MHASVAPQLVFTSIGPLHLDVSRCNTKHVVHDPLPIVYMSLRRLGHSCIKENATKRFLSDD